MNDFFQQIINGLAVGSMYALIALGYTMVYGVLRLINFAHGDVYMVGAFVACYTTRLIQQAFGLDDNAGQSLWTALLAMMVAMVVCAGLGYCIERFCYRPLRKSSRLYALITAIGVSLLLESLLQIQFYIGNMRFFGSTPTHVAQVEVAGTNLSDRIGWINDHLHLTITWVDVLTFLATAICLLGLRYIVMHTRTGKAMRAVSVNFDASSLMGINVNSIISFTFMLGSALAAVGGFVYGLRYHTIEPLMGVLYGLKAFIAAVIGGIGNIPGAAMGGLLLGLVEAFVAYGGGAKYQDAAAFVILILMLLVRPDGIFGKALPEKV